MSSSFTSGHVQFRCAASPARSARAMKIGLVLKMFPRLSETFILNEVLELERQGVRLHIFSLKRPADAVLHGQSKLVRSPITYLPEKIYRGPLRIALGQCHVATNHPRRWRRTMLSVLRRLTRGGDNGMLTAFCQACCIVREMGKVRHLHAHYANVPAKVALLVHRLTGISFSITTHAKDIFQNDPFASPKLHERMSRASFIVANSRFSADHIRSQLREQRPIHTIYNGVDLEAFSFHRNGQSEPLILSVGRLVEKKGFSDLIAACHMLKQRGINFTCELVGTGRLSDALKQQIADSGLQDRIRMIGPLPQETLREHYGRAMIFALPCIAASDGDRDILPNVLKEAMATGVPVVTTRLDGIEELIEDGVSGLLIEPGNVAALADRLELLLADAQLRQRLAGRAREVIEERFDRRTNFALLRKLLSEAAQPVATVAPQALSTEVDLQHAHSLC